MKSKELLILIITFLFIVIHSGCKDSPTESNDRDTLVHVKKPNIYIYPLENIYLSVNISFPKGGQVTESIPKYNNGWNVSVNSNGIINNEYQYLFYECDVPNLFQNEKGWVIKRENLNSFFENNLISCGFSENEIKDFTDYWIPKLIDSNYYEIYPQYSLEIEKMIVLNFSIKPDNVFRLYYLIKGRDNNELNLAAPKIESSIREKYYVMEWGVINKFDF